MQSVGGGGWSRSALTVMATATGRGSWPWESEGRLEVTSSKAWGDRQRYPNIGRLHCACPGLYREGWPTREWRPPGLGDGTCVCTWACAALPTLALVPS